MEGVNEQTKFIENHLGVEYLKKSKIIPQRFLRYQKEYKYKVVPRTISSFRYRLFYLKEESL